jgi:hypothetical protein
VSVPVAVAVVVDLRRDSGLVRGRKRRESAGWWPLQVFVAAFVVAVMGGSGFGCRKKT